MTGVTLPHTVTSHHKEIETARRMMNVRADREHCRRISCHVLEVFCLLAISFLGSFLRSIFVKRETDLY